jgi:hypothetical protein
MSLQDTTEPTRQSVPLLAGCAAASLGLLFVQTGALLGGLTPFNALPESLHPRTVLSVSLVAPVLALVIWHLFPRRSWAALLMTGALCALPRTIIDLDPGPVDLAPGSRTGSLSDPVAVLTLSAPVFILVGALGAAALIWQAGRPALGATLAGAAVATQVVGPAVMMGTDGFMFAPSATRPVVGLLLTIFALVGGGVAVIATVRQPGEPAARPRWRVTLAAGLAGFAPLLTWKIDGERYTTISTTTDGLVDLVGNHFLYLGLVFLGAGVIAGSIAGIHALVGAAAVGLTLGAFSSLFTLLFVSILEQQTLTVIVALGSLVIGVGAGLSRWRAQIGMVGLAVVTVGLVVLSFLPDSNASYEQGSRYAIAALLMLGVIAGAAAFPGIGAAHAANSETPAVLTTLPVAFALGVIALTNHFGFHASSDRPTTGLLLPTAGALLVAALLVAFIAASGRAGAPEGR